jgi:type I restriction enzyme S subunit
MLGRWPTAALGELCDIRGGFPAPQDDAAFEEGVIPFVRMKDVGRHHLTNNLCETDQSLSRAHFEKGRYQLTPRGSILMPRSGSVGLNHRAILTLDAVVVSHLCALVPTSDKVTTDFLYRFLCLADMRKLTKKTTGLDSIAFSDLRMVAIPLPPLAEQRRIAEVLDKAEALRAKRRAALAQLDSLTQSLFLDLFGDPATNPKGWPNVPLGLVVKLVGGYAFKSEDFASQGKAVVRISNLTGDGIDLDGIARIPDDKLGRGASYKIQPGDILIAMSGATTGKIGVAPLELPEDLYLNQRVGSYRICDMSRIQREFLIALLRSKFYQRFLWQLAAGAAQPNVSGRQLESANIPLPPLDLQREFARRVAAVEKLKTAQRAALAELDALFASLQHRAFRGEL